MKIEWNKVREAYLFGWRAKHGDIEVEVLRVDTCPPASWSVFGKIGGEIIKEGPETPQHVSEQEALRAGTRILRGEVVPPTWPKE